MDGHPRGSARGTPVRRRTGRLASLCVAPLLALAACTSPAVAPDPLPYTGSPPGTAAPPGTVAFPGPAGKPLHGMVYGHGGTAVVLSNMGDNDPARWKEFAPVLAGTGHTVLSYDFGYRASDPFTATSAQEAVADLRAALAYLRTQGVQRFVLIGASLGGMVTAKAATEPGVVALAILSAPADLSDYGLSVTAADLASAVPKLFVYATGDPVVAPAATRQLADLAAGPKQVQSYPESEHGVHLFGTASGGALRERLLQFVTAADS